MLLSGDEIVSAINSGDLLIDPILAQSIRPASICLHLSNEFIRQDAGGVVDVLNGDTYPIDERFFLEDGEGIIVPPLGFLLGCTIEHVGLANNIFGHLSNISGLARLGLNVLLSTHVAPGFGFINKKKIVLEIFNSSKRSIRIYPGMRICHLCVGKLAQGVDHGYDQLFPEKYSMDGVSRSEFYRPSSDC